VATIDLNEAEPAKGRNRARPTQREHFRRKPNPFDDIWNDGRRDPLGPVESKIDAGSRPACRRGTQISRDPVGAFAQPPPGHFTILRAKGEIPMKWMFMPWSLAIAALLLALPRAQAAGPYDGDWYVDAAPAGQAQPTAESSGCDAVRIEFRVIDNRVTGNLRRSPYGTGRVESGEGGPPISGTVQPDGTVNAQWQNYRATGKLTGDRAEVRWNGECGLRVATGARTGATGSTQQRQ